MTFDFLPLKIPRWLRMMIIVATLGMIIRAALTFGDGKIWFGFLFAAMALIFALARKVFQLRSPVSLQLDEKNLIQVGTSKRVIPWASIENVRSCPGSMALYYKDGPEPRLLDLEAARFRSEDWEVIRSFILSRTPDVQGER